VKARSLSTSPQHFKQACNRTLKRKSLVGGFRSSGYAHKGGYGKVVSSPYFIPRHEMSMFLPLHIPTMIFCLTQAQKQQIQPTMVWNFWNCVPKGIFLLHKLIISGTLLQ
jgi:hypothetical protein